MFLLAGTQRDERAGPHAAGDIDVVRVLVVGCGRPRMARVRAALAHAGQVTLGAAQFDAALALVDEADVVVAEPRDDAELVPTLARALPDDATLVLYGDCYEWLGRAGRPVTVVPDGALPALLDVVAAGGPGPPPPPRRGGPAPPPRLWRARPPPRAGG